MITLVVFDHSVVGSWRNGTKPMPTLFLTGAARSVFCMGHSGAAKGWCLHN